jgi:hypothetical protein
LTKTLAKNRVSRQYGAGKVDPYAVSAGGWCTVGGAAGYVLGDRRWPPPGWPPLQ